MARTTADRTSFAFNSKARGGMRASPLSASIVTLSATPVPVSAFTVALPTFTVALSSSKEACCLPTMAMSACVVPIAASTAVPPSNTSAGMAQLTLHLSRPFEITGRNSGAGSSTLTRKTTPLWPGNQSQSHSPRTSTMPCSSSSECSSAMTARCPPSRRAPST